MQRKAGTRIPYVRNPTPRYRVPAGSEWRRGDGGGGCRVKVSVEAWHEAVVDASGDRHALERLNADDLHAPRAVPSLAGLIAMLPQRLQRAAELRWIDGASWEQMAESLGISTRAAKRLHAEAQRAAAALLADSDLLPLDLEHYL